MTFKKPTGALDICFILFGTFQQCAPTKHFRNRIYHLTVKETIFSNSHAPSARFRLGISTSPINDIKRIILQVHLWKWHTSKSWINRSLSPIDGVEIREREQASVTQRSETVGLWVWLPPGSVGAHCWKVPNRTKQLSSTPTSFGLQHYWLMMKFSNRKF